MKILLLTDYFPPHIGGVERVFAHSAEGLASHGEEFFVLTMQRPADAPREETHPFPLHRVRIPAFLERGFFTILALPKGFAWAKQAELIQTTTGAAAFPAWLLSQLLRKRCLLMVHEYLGHRWFKLKLSPWHALFSYTAEWLMFSLPFHHYVCVSQATRRDLLLHKPKLASRTSVIYPGVEESMGLPCPPSSPFTLTFFGRLGVSKGAYVLLEALALVKEKIPHLHLQMIVSKEPAAAYKKTQALIQKLQLTNQVELSSSLPREALKKKVLNSHGVVIPSQTEGFGFSALEACHWGMPVVVTRQGSLPEVVFGKVIFVESGSATSLAQGILKLFAQDWETIAPKKFPWDATIEAYLKLYHA